MASSSKPPVETRLTLLRPLSASPVEPDPNAMEHAATASSGTTTTAAAAREAEDRARADAPPKDVDGARTEAEKARKDRSQRATDPDNAAERRQDNDKAQPAPHKAAERANEPREPVNKARERDAAATPPPPREVEAKPTPASERQDEADEPEPEVVVAEADREDHEKWLDFVRNSDDALDAKPTSAAHVSNRSSAANIETRAHARTEALAKTPTPDASQRQDPAEPTLHEVDGTPSDPAGNRPSPTPSHEVGTVAGGGGHKAVGEASRAAGAAGVEVNGGQAAPPGVASAQAAAPSTSAPTESSAASRQGERPIPQDDAPSWWHPTAFFAAPAAQADPVDASPTPSPPSPTRAARRAPVPTTQPLRQRGGNAGEVEHVAAAGEPPSEQPGEGDPQVDAGVSDPVQSLRDALGWGGIDRSALAPRAAVAGTSSGTGEPNAASNVVLNDKFLLDDNMFINAEGTALGAYIARMDDGIHDAWEQIDLATHDKGIGITGNVTVYFRVQPSGKVADVQLLASSGNAAIDRKALLAIPKRVERRPNDVELAGDLHRKITFVYRDAISLGGGR